MLKESLLILVLSGISIGQLGSAQSQERTATTDCSTSQFVFGPSEVSVPKGAFLLVRKGREIGAIMFTSIELTKTEDPGKATYESYFQGDGSSSFQGANVVKRTGVIDLKRLKGIGRLSFQTGRRKIQVGKWSFASDYPGRVNMWPYHGEERDYGYEFAPTSARDVKEIDASDKRLRWFRFDPNTSVAVPVADLPK
jgi:hypothetical protein